MKPFFSGPNDNVPFIMGASERGKFAGDL